MSKQKRQHFDPKLVSDEKDLLISQLKADLHELRQNEQDYNELNIHYNNLNHKLMLMIEEKNRLEKDSRQRNENSLKSAFALNQEYDRIKGEISRENLRIQEIKAKNDEMKQNHEQKIGDIGKTRNELAVWKEKMGKLKEEKSYLNLKNKEANDEKNEYLSKIESLKNKFAMLVRKNKEFAGILDDLEGKKDKFEQKNIGFSKIIEEKKGVLKKKEGNLKKSNEKLEQIQHEIASLEKDIDQIQANIEQYKSETQNHQKIYQNELKKEDDLNVAVKNLSSKMKVQDDFLMEVKNILGNIQSNNEDLYENNSKIMNKIERFQEELSDMKNVKLQLTESLMEYGEKMEKAKAGFHKKEKLNEAVQNALNKIKTSTNNVEKIIEKYEKSY